MNEKFSVWEGEGGSVNETSGEAMTGTVNQIESAKQIRTQVNAEFDRVITALEAAATKQSGQDRMDTQTIIAIVEEKRTEVMEHQDAGYFIHDWQELRDRVRRRHVTRCRLGRCAPSFTIVRVSAHGVLRSKQAISLLQH